MTTQHLIHIGYPKSGSTFLQAWFQAHPELCYQPGALGGFYDLYGICRFASGESDPQYRYRVTSGEALSTPSQSTGTLQPKIEAGPLKPAQAKVCAVLQQLFPGSRVLIVTRGFKGIIQSGYSQLARIGGTLHPSEMSALLEQGLQSDLHHYYDFDYLIQLYAGAFGADNVIVLPYELLRDDQSAFLDALEKRLGLAHVELKIGRENASLSPTELYWYPVISRRVSALSNRLGARMSQKIRARYVGGTLNNRWHRAIRVLDRAFPGRKITSEDFLWAEVLRLCEGKADSLRDNPLYAPYAADYLW